MIEISLRNESNLPLKALPLLASGPLGKGDLPAAEDIELFGANSKPGSQRVHSAGQLYLVVGAGTKLNLRNFGAEVARSGASAQINLDFQSEAEVLELVEGLALGGKTPTRFKTEESKTQVVEIVTHDYSWMEISQTLAVCADIVKIRELINLPANELWPDQLANEAKNIVSELPIEVEIWDEAKLEAERCGGILSVGKGSARPPRLVKLSYRGGGKRLALVGKGITFDTGGLSLKPPEGMVGMKYDMAGSATILGAISAIARLGLKLDVTAYMCLAENMPSGTATRPGDVIRIRNGKTVEVLNTDAEGRLVLADGLSLAVEDGADHIIDVATLTGAATIALGKLC